MWLYLRGHNSGFGALMIQLQQGLTCLLDQILVSKFKTWLKFAVSGLQFNVSCLGISLLNALYSSLLAVHQASRISSKIC